MLRPTLLSVRKKVSFVMDLHYHLNLVLFTDHGSLEFASGNNMF